MRREMRKIRLKLRRLSDWIDGLAGQLLIAMLAVALAVAANASA